MKFIFINNFKFISYNYIGSTLYIYIYICTGNRGPVGRNLCFNVRDPGLIPEDS